MTVTHACQRACLADSPAQPPQPGLRNTRVCSLASPFGSSENHQEKARERGRRENQQLGQLWSLAIVTCNPRTIKIRHLFDVLPFTVLACSIWFFGSLSLVPSSPCWGSEPTLQPTLSSQVSCCPWRPTPSLILPLGLRAWGRHSPSLPTFLCQASSPLY